MKTGDQIMLHPPAKHLGVDGGVELGGADKLAIYARANRVGAALFTPVNQAVRTLAHGRVSVGAGHAGGAANLVGIG